MTLPRCILPQPILSPSSPDRWTLLAPYSFNGFTVPAGFDTDLDSIPRLPLAFSLFKHRTRTAALLHDYLYSIGYNRLESDRIFLRFMVAEGVLCRHAIPIYLAVRLFGWLFWSPDNSKNKTCPSPSRGVKGGQDESPAANNRAGG